MRFLFAAAVAVLNFSFGYGRAHGDRSATCSACNQW